MTDHSNEPEKANENQVETSEEQFSEIGSAISSMPKESLKSLLYLVAGKQDSNYSLFTRPIFIDIDDIFDLNERIQEKFSHYQTSGIVTVDIMYDKNRAMHFGTWVEFQSHNWQTSKKIESFSIRWDFMLKMPEFPIPQRHTLTLKIVSRIDPMHLLHAITSRDSTDLIEIEIGAAPIIARVDFISHLLSDELLKIVDEWIETREVAEFEKDLLKWLRSKRRHLARFSHYSIPTLIALLSLGLIRLFDAHFGTSGQIDSFSLTCMMYWMLGTGVSIPVFTIIGRFFGNRIASSLEQYGYHTPFNVTNGDRAYQKYKREKNKKTFRNFVLYSIWTILLNFSAAYISFLVFTK